eukprot:4138882-Amphidinium_carterae.1
MFTLEYGGPSWLFAAVVRASVLTRCYGRESCCPTSQDHPACVGRHYQWPDGPVANAAISAQLLLSH